MSDINSINKELSDATIVFTDECYSIYKKVQYLTMYLDFKKESSHYQKEIEDIWNGYSLAINLSQYPSEELLDLAHTENLEEHWYGLRNFNFNTALEFLALYLKIEGERLDMTSDNELVKELIHYSGIRYYDLWNIVKLSFSHIKKQVPNISGNEKSLFLKIIEDEGNYPFEKVVVNDYVFMDMKKINELANKVINKIINKTEYLEIDKKKIPLLQAVLILASQSKSRSENRMLKFHIDRYNKTTEHIAMVVQEIAMDRTSQGLTTPSWVWKSGEIINNVRGRKPKP